MTNVRQHNFVQYVFRSWLRISPATVIVRPERSSLDLPSPPPAIKDGSNSQLNFITLWSVVWSYANKGNILFICTKEINFKTYTFPPSHPFPSPNQGITGQSTKHIYIALRLRKRNKQTSNPVLNKRQNYFLLPWELILVSSCLSLVWTGITNYHRLSGL